MRVTSLGALLIASLASAQGDEVRPTVEVEPNNRMKQATLFEPDRVLSGQLESSDVDFFRFSLDDRGQSRDVRFELDTKVRVNLCLWGADGERIKCSKGTATTFRNLTLSGEYGLSLSPVAKLASPVAYRLSFGSPQTARAGFEVEPNDRWGDASPIVVGEKVRGDLPLQDLDSFTFRVDGRRQVWRVEALGTAVATLELRTVGGIKLQHHSSRNGAVSLENLLLPQGDYVVRVGADRKSADRDYTIALISLGPADAPDLSKIALNKEASRPSGVLEAEPNDSDGQAQRLSFDQPGIGLLDKTDTDMYHFFLPGNGRIRIEAQPPAGGQLSFTLSSGAAAKSPDVGEAAVFEGDLLPGDHFLKLRTRPVGNGFYQLTMTQLDPLAAGVSELQGISLTVAGDTPTLAAFESTGQALNFEVILQNRGNTSKKLEVLTSSSAKSWRPTASEKNLSLGAGESKRVAVRLEVLDDARSGLPVLLSFGVRDSVGAVVSETLTLNAECGATPVNPGRIWPLPNELLGRINAAAAGLGARIVAPRRDDANGFNGVVSRSSGAWAKPGEAITIDLAGDTPLTILGTVIHPVGLRKRGRQLKKFEIMTSIDGVSFDRVLAGVLTADAAEQAFVFEQPVLAKFAQIRLLSNQDESSRSTGFGEWKLIVKEPAHKILGKPLNIADNAIGGYDVYSSPFIGTACCHDFFSTLKQDGQFRRTDDDYEWVMGFHESRAARITGLRWVEPLSRNAPRRDLQSIDVAVSMDSPVGPWTDLGSWDLLREESGVKPWQFDAPIWARFLKFNAVPQANTGAANIPTYIGVIEQTSDDTYRSVIGEWGYTNRAAIYEYQHPTVQETTRTGRDAGDNRQSATLLKKGIAGSGDVLVGEDIDWYAIDVPDGTNQLRLALTGNPVVEYAYELQDSSGRQVVGEVRGIEGGIELEVDAAPGRYYLKLFEPPRSIIFSWDTSGSVGPFYDVIDQTMKSFAAGIRQGREEVNLLPFNDPAGFLLEEWSGDSIEVTSAVVNSDRKFGSSDLEGALLEATRNLDNRQGTRAVLIITDAETDGYGKTATLWHWLKKVQPRIFSFEISSAGSPTAQDIMQSYANVNQGFYDQAFSAGDLQVGFDRATCLIRRAKNYRVSADFDITEPKPNGQLLVQFEPGSALATDAVEVILDASGSMYQKLDGRFRYEIAKEVLDDLVATTLPDGIGFALRVFGNRDASSCRTDLEVELAPLNRSVARSVIAAIEPQQYAYTPIADALANVASDLESVSGRKTVVLVTDGEESCDGDVEAAIEKLKQSDIDVQLNVIGFDFDAVDKTAAREQFRSWADLGGGEYYDAANADELAMSLTQAVQGSTHYDVLNTNGDIVMKDVAYGKLVDLRPGQYQIRTTGLAPPLTVDAVVHSGKTSKVQLKP